MMMSYSLIKPFHHHPTYVSGNQATVKSKLPLPSEKKEKYCGFPLKLGETSEQNWEYYGSPKKIT
jgi:hypothetical protein